MLKESPPPPIDLTASRSLLLTLSGEYLEVAADAETAMELSEGAVVETKSVPDIGDCASFAALFHHSSCTSFNYLHTDVVK